MFFLSLELILLLNFCPNITDLKDNSGDSPLASSDYNVSYRCIELDSDLAVFIPFYGEIPEYI